MFCVIRDGMFGIQMHKLAAARELAVAREPAWKDKLERCRQLSKVLIARLRQDALEVLSVEVNSVRASPAPSASSRCTVSFFRTCVAFQLGVAES